MNNGVIMNTSDTERYYNILRINPARNSVGYTKTRLGIAREFVNTSVYDVENSNLLDDLLSCFKDKNPYSSVINRAKAGLCLRCYVSHAIVEECRRIDNLYSGNKKFSYRDFLPLVLNDDGQQLIILASDGRTQLTLDTNSVTNESTINLFSVQVLQSFDPDLESGMSLYNWVRLRTRQNHQVRTFLSNSGLNHLSDWAILNRATTEQIGRLSLQEQRIIEAYHAVYRRDRIEKPCLKPIRCPDPTSAQLQEMSVYLRYRKVSIDTPTLLLQELYRIALQLRRYDIWSYREPLEIYDAQSDTLIPRSDLPTDSFDEVDIERLEISQFLQEHLESALTRAIRMEVEAKIQELRNSSRYAPFAPQYLQGLKLYYSESMSLGDIAPILGMRSWNQARRILDPGKLLLQVRAKTEDSMLESILRLAGQRGFTPIPPKASYFKALAEEVESYIDEEIFQEASEEMRAGRNRSMNSPYAQAIVSFLQDLV
ncbi:hypothetical protein NIES267_34330 [Calothrix parasitica NIES-267]|uniref:Uncharacterized protein n=1 Tax=Calothrix parasitica NIES-267 TaxID=1973488 RepID=A0A1Z4LRR0_9CYAN|nr:hypothetical protein NIES267_34330 [Calothrix parasitica NIES-267]